MTKQEYCSMFRLMDFIHWQKYIDQLNLYKGDVSRFIQKGDLKRLSLDKCRLLYNAVLEDFQRFV